MSEIMAVWSTLNFFVETKNDAVATGLLRLIKHKRFMLLFFAALNKIFQEGCLHFAQTVYCGNNICAFRRHEQ